MWCRETTQYHTKPHTWSVWSDTHMHNWTLQLKTAGLKLETALKHWISIRNMFLVKIETDVWGGDTGKCKQWERGFREQFKYSSYIEKQSRDAQEDLLQEKEEGKETRKSPKSSFSLTFTCSFWSRLPCSPVSPDLPPSQPLSSHLLNGVLCILITQSKHRRKKTRHL